MKAYPWLLEPCLVQSKCREQWHALHHCHHLQCFLVMKWQVLLHQRPLAQRQTSHPCQARHSLQGSLLDRTYRLPHSQGLQRWHLAQARAEALQRCQAGYQQDQLLAPCRLTSARSALRVKKTGFVGKLQCCGVALVKPVAA